MNQVPQDRSRTNTTAWRRRKNGCGWTACCTILYTFRIKTLMTIIYRNRRRLTVHRLRVSFHHSQLLGVGNFFLDESPEEVISGTAYGAIRAANSALSFGGNWDLAKAGSLS